MPDGWYWSPSLPSAHYLRANRSVCGQRFKPNGLGHYLIVQLKTVGYRRICQRCERTMKIVDLRPLERRR